MAEFSRTDLNVPYPRWQTESNCLLGFSAENQEYFDSRWADMRKLAAMGWKVFASIEPQIGPVDCSAALALVHGTECTICGLPATARMRHVHRESLSWCVIGGESGHGARPFNIQWMRDSIAQFKAAGVPLWCKQFGALARDRPLIGDYVFGSHGSDWSLWAPDLRVRQLPELRL
jgi:protein gp37